MSKSQDRLNALAEEVASRLIEQLEKGTAPWQKPWNGVTSRPHNPITASQYSGANWLCLQMARCGGQTAFCQRGPRAAS